MISKAYAVGVNDREFALGIAIGLIAENPVLQDHVRYFRLDSERGKVYHLVAFDDCSQISTIKTDMIHDVIRRLTTRLNYDEVPHVAFELVFEE